MDDIFSEFCKLLSGSRLHLLALRLTHKPRHAKCTNSTGTPALIPSLPSGHPLPSVPLRPPAPACSEGRAAESAAHTPPPGCGRPEAEAPA